MAPVKSPTLYIDRKPYFLEAPPRATNLPPHWLPSLRGRAPTVPRRAKEEGGQGGGAPLGSTAVGAPCAAAARRLLHPGRRLSLMGRHTSSSSTTPLHHPQCNLLANMMFDVIYYISVIYFVAMSCVEWLLVLGNGDTTQARSEKAWQLNWPDCRAKISNPIPTKIFPPGH
jgi:hypothetical protein